MDDNFRVLIELGVPAWDFAERNQHRARNPVDLILVRLADVDDLQGIANKNLALRESQLEECLGLVKNQTQYFMDWLLKEKHA